MQRNVIVSAQIVLARYGLYREQIDGVYGPAMELSLRAYQARTRLPVTADWIWKRSGAALVAGTAPAFLQSLSPAYASSPWAAGSWSMGARLVLVWIIETHRLQFGENCAHENLCLDAKDEPLGIV